MRAHPMSSILALTFACGGGDGAPGMRLDAAGAKASAQALPPVDACTILTREEIESAVGWKVDSTGPGAAAFQGSACNFYGKTISDLVGVAIADQGLTEINSSAELAQFFSDTARHGMYAVDAKPLDGLGVPASVYQMGWTVVTALAKGHRRVDVTSPTEVASRTLMTKLLARLP
jgi:hypothetical protein